MNNNNNKKPKPYIEQIRLICRSCDHDWIMNKPKGFYIRYRKGNNFLLDRTTGIKQPFKCPKCSKNKVARLAVKKVSKG